MRKFESIDLMKLYAQGSANGWNEMLTKKFNERNINALAKTRYQIQAGMDDLAKKKLNDETMITFYIRLLKSLEDTAKKILRVLHPMPGDNPLIANKYPNKLAAKRARDQEWAAFLHKSAY